MSRKKTKSITYKRGVELNSIRSLVFSKKIFNKEQKGEAFIVLHSLLEYELEKTWMYLAQSIYKKIYKKKYEGFISDRRGYYTFMQLLFETGILSSSEKKILYEFNNARNQFAHSYYHPSRGLGVNTKQVNGKFKSGLKGFRIIFNARFKIQKEFDPDYNEKIEIHRDLNKLFKKLETNITYVPNEYL